MTAGRITRVNGPVVHVVGLDRPVRHEFVEVGEQRLPGEIIALQPDGVVTQVYEYTGGLAVGEPAWGRHRPLAVRLGPHLLGGIYDGLLRPLGGEGEFLGVRGLGAVEIGPCPFEPTVEAGANVGPGTAIGSVGGDRSVEHLVQVPTGVSGTVDWIAAAGLRDADEPVASIGGTSITIAHDWPIRRPRPATRHASNEPFVTGQRVLDVLEPIVRGSTATVIGGFGEGKTMLLEQIAKWGDADVIVYVGCGERGNELADLIDELGRLVDPRSGRPLLERTVLLANTSNMPVMAREASIYSAVTIAEYYRDMGHHAVIIADSTSRWAEAQRELGSRTGAIPAEEGYPADLPAALAAFYQRAGAVTTPAGLEGSVTIVTSVSPPGGDTTEPVSAHTQRFVQAVWSLDRELAYSRHYPAISWHRSFSRDAAGVGRWHTTRSDPDWSARRARLQAILSEADRLATMADLVGLGGLPTAERVALLAGRLVREAVLQQNALSEHDAFCSLDKQAAIVEGVLRIVDRARALADAGVPASVIEGIDLGPLVRAKDEVGPDDAAGVRAIVDELDRRLEEVTP